MNRFKSIKGSATSGFIAFILIAAIVIASLAGWVNNILWTFHQSAAVNLALGIVGVFAVPVGVIHGIWLWF
jgi:membrane protein YdbS with pleckstrin-like domain